VKYPALPKRLDAPGGAVTIVRVVGDLTAQGVACWGTWEPHTRTIEVSKGAPMAHQWKVLFHELAHVALDDSGLSNGLTDEMQEALCDAVATARMRERFG
jgi:hypothetical protein